MDDKLLFGLRQLPRMRAYRGPATKPKPSDQLPSLSWATPYSLQRPYPSNLNPFLTRRTVSSTPATSPSTRSLNDRSA